MAALVTQKMGTAPSFTPLSGSGASFKPVPGVFEPSAPPPGPEQIKEDIIEKCSTAVLQVLRKAFADEIDIIAAAASKKEVVEGAQSFTHAIPTIHVQTGEKGMVVTKYGMRTELLKKQHVLKIELSNAAQVRCFNAILTRCVEKIHDRQQVVLAFYLLDCEALTPETVDKSPILRSKVFKVVITKVTTDMLKLF